MAFGSLAVLFSAGLFRTNGPVYLSPYGLATTTFVVASKLPIGFDKPDDAVVLSEEGGQAPEGFQFLKSAEAQPSEGYVGVYVPAEAVFQVRKRAMKNLGNGSVTLRLAKSSTRSARVYELRPGSTADYNEWRRCAMQRTQKDAWPPKKPGKPNVPNGTLVIVGGGGMTRDIAKAFVDAGGGDNGQFVMLPISMPDPINIAQEEQFMHQMGVKNVTVIPFREKSDLEDPKVIDTLKKATGIWFGGGRQWNFVDAYEDTVIPVLFHDVLSRGGVVGGSSAGATIIGDYMVRGAPAGPNLMMCEGYERAMGFLPGVAIDQHFSARNRFKDMTSLMKTYPQFLGIGLDEATAIVVKGSTAEILGQGKAHFYDTRKKYLPEGPDYDAYPAGLKYDLDTRKLID